MWVLGAPDQRLNITGSAQPPLRLQNRLSLPHRIKDSFFSGASLRSLRLYACFPLFGAYYSEYGNSRSPITVGSNSESGSNDYDGPQYSGGAESDDAGEKGEVEGDYELGSDSDSIAKKNAQEESNRIRDEWEEKMDQFWKKLKVAKLNANEQM
ncbi:hypothetical protein BU16DRAFT_539723 [Lophium mytilinum]|uniref:Uncharacterized protein n=1 Tax=Lophium mytilinum TaxID=390894 RepID=A0A6A6QQJ0_9PEZI|nr:hypothetical protein BU16DRAFT_539723 [Lophium mytilinum]